MQSPTWTASGMPSTATLRHDNVSRRQVKRHAARFGPSFRRAQHRRHRVSQPLLARPTRHALAVPANLTGSAYTAALRSRSIRCLRSRYFAQPSGLSQHSYRSPVFGERLPKHLKTNPSSRTSPGFGM